MSVTLTAQTQTVTKAHERHVLKQSGKNPIYTSLFIRRDREAFQRNSEMLRDELSMPKGKGHQEGRKLTHTLKKIFIIGTIHFKS